MEDMHGTRGQKSQWIRGGLVKPASCEVKVLSSTQLPQKLTSVLRRSPGPQMFRGTFTREEERADTLQMRNGTFLRVQILLQEVI